MIVVDQMDGNQLPWLICPTDRATNVRLNSTGGAMFEAVNQVAAALESEFPTVTIMTEAYEASQFVPDSTFRFRPNVAVRVAMAAECHEGVPRSLPLTDHRNELWMERLRAWKRAAPRVYTYIYAFREAYTCLLYTSPSPRDRG